MERRRRPRGGGAGTASLAQRLPPRLEFLLDLLARALLAEDDARPVAVLLQHLVLREDVLPVPRGVGVRWDPAAARRVGEADPFGAVEHQRVDVIPGVSE